MWLTDLLSGKKQNRFFELLQRHCAQLVEAAELLERYAQSGSPELSDRIDQIEKDADAVLTETITELTDTFITPIDRQDIFNLAEAVDNMIDYLNNAAREIKLFQTGSTPAMCTMAGILNRAAHEIAAAAAALQRDARDAQAHAFKASQAENEMEEFYRQTLAALFNETDVNRILKLREIYRHFSNSADQADSIGKLIGKIVVKTA
jgi:predicted phosphate transport protein (TIGR00153 family)